MLEQHALRMLDTQLWLAYSTILSCGRRPHNALIYPDAAYARDFEILSEDLHTAARLISRVIYTELCLMSRKVPAL